MSSSLRKLPVRHPVVVDIGCNCRRPKLSFLFTSTSRSKAKATLTDPFSPTTTTTTTSSFTAATFTATTDTSACEDTPSPAKQISAAGSPAVGGRGTRRRRKKGRVARESVAVVKESAEPYADFRESMVQMIVEKEIYAWEDLNDLLHSFLALNSPRHHHLILRAFTDLWSGVFSAPSTSLLSNR
ncbi:transcription repressor OFP8-like [Phoenix dactylifera]|uniref:Transcription repressor n=1 Tax=Phoenix dactylifera TaxID=42345 RepID=A0A8B7CZK7_PHODC|nr:transcription repressor OFP8-like [Phoenix dactylifera]